MSDSSHKFAEAPIITLETHDEFIRALNRLRALRGATGNSVAGLEATALDRHYSLPEQRGECHGG